MSEVLDPRKFRAAYIDPDRVIMYGEDVIADVYDLIKAEALVDLAKRAAPAPEKDRSFGYTWNNGRYSELEDFTFDTREEALADAAQACLESLAEDCDIPEGATKEEIVAAVMEQMQVSVVTTWERPFTDWVPSLDHVVSGMQENAYDLFMDDEDAGEAPLVRSLYTLKGETVEARAEERDRILKEFEAEFAAFLWSFSERHGGDPWIRIYREEP